MRINLTYRQKLRLKKVLKWLLIVLAVLAVSLILFLIFVERYVVYGQDGVHIDYDRPVSRLEVSPTAPTQPTAPMQVEIFYDTPFSSTDEYSRMKGYLVTTDDLKNPDSVLMSLADLGQGSTVLLQLKDYAGLFYYNTNLAGAKRADVDIEGISTLISKLRQNGCSLIALMPAFADDAYALAHPEFALPKEDGSLWVGDHRSYWLNPDSNTVLTYLEQMATELSSKGFNEVVFSDFYFPEDEGIVYEPEPVLANPPADEEPEEGESEGDEDPGEDEPNEDGSTEDEENDPEDETSEEEEPTEPEYLPAPTRREMTAAAIRRLVNHFADTTTVISFMTDSNEYPMMGTRNRLYITGADAAQIDRFLSVYQWDGWNPDTNLVFITSSKDSRFDDRNTLAPLP